MIDTRKSLLTCLIALAVLITATSSLQQSDAREEPLWLYTINETDESFDLMKVSLIDGQSDTLVSFSKTAQFSLLSVIPDSEADEATNLFQKYPDAYPQLDTNEFLSRQPSVTVRLMSPSPDNDSVALLVTYQACARGLYDSACFGTSQVVLISGTTGDQQVLLNLGRHSNQYFPGEIRPLQDVTITDLLWLPDQQALVAAISSAAMRRSRWNSSIVVIPTLQGLPAFPIGKGDTWAVAPTSREVTLTSRSHTGRAVSVINFDLTGEYSETSYPLGEYVVVWVPFGHIYLHTSSVFLIRDDAASVDGVVSVVVFSANEPDPFDLNQPQIGGFRSIRAAPTGNVAAIQSDDGLLWKATLSNEELQIEPVTTLPVSYWQFVKDDLLVIQYEGSTEYHVLDLMPE